MERGGARAWLRFRFGSIERLRGQALDAAQHEQRSRQGGNLVLAALGTVAWGLSRTVSLYAQPVLATRRSSRARTAVMTVIAVVGSTTGHATVTRMGFTRWPRLCSS
jgi:hypothetical protein